MRRLSKGREFHPNCRSHRARSKGAELAGSIEQVILLAKQPLKAGLVFLLRFRETRAIPSS